jgi:beta-glucosidase-like glycosyl hydrolase/CubicO group peptidase (beta-lactamase class C family)
MTLEEKVSQLFSVRASGYFQNVNEERYWKLVDLVEEFQVGGIIFGPGNLMAQATLTNDLQQRAVRPLLISQDMEWGPGMRLDEASTFPPAMAIGATRNPEYAYLAGYATAREARTLGTHQVYAPVADINNNPNNPVINTRSFGEDPELVAQMAADAVRGLQIGGAIATVKHFPGHGDTDTDSHIDLPVIPFSRARLDTLELVPFRAAIRAGVESVMTGHLAFPALETDATVPATLSPVITESLLRNELGFDGLVVTDALDMQGVTRHFGAGETAVRAIEAGSDMLLMSEDPYVARKAILDAVESGRLSEARIDRSVQRILEQKEKMQLHHRRLVSMEAVQTYVSQRSHRALEDEIARASITLLRNEESLLPLVPPEGKRVLVITLNDSENPYVGNTFIRTLRGGPSVGGVAVRRLHSNSDADDYDEVLTDATRFDVVVVASFLRVRSWSGRIGLPEAQATFLNEIAQVETPVALAAFGNPYAIMSVTRQPTAYLAAYGTNRASQRAAAQAITGQSGTPGKLPVTIPDRYGYGSGIHLEQVSPRVDAPEAIGMDGRQLYRIDSLMHAGMLNEAFPGAAIAVGRGQTIAKLDGIGYYTYAAKEETSSQARYDLASLTKVVATTTAIMKLHEAGEVELDAPVVDYLPAFGQNGKDGITIRQLLSHSAGFKPYLGAEERGPSPQAIVDTIMAQPLQYEPGTESRYSGLGMITLMRIVETVSGQDFATFCEEEIFEPLGMYSTDFRSVGRVDPDVVPATDTTDILIQGFVHDPVAQRMNGISGNAGLFSTAEDLARFATMLVNDGRIYGQQFLEKETIDLFTRRVNDVPGSTRALGWDTKSDDGYSSAGQLFGDRSFGHTGYTGTSFWVDPDQDLYAILLTNRVYPDDTDRQISQYRPQFADIVYQSLVAPPAPILPDAPPCYRGAPVAAREAADCDGVPNAAAIGDR